MNEKKMIMIKKKKVYVQVKCFLASVFCYQNCKEILKYPPNIRRVVGNNGTHESLTDVQIRVSVHEKKKKLRSISKLVVTLCSILLLKS